MAVFQKTDPGMNSGVQALEDCLASCKRIGARAENISQELRTGWTGRSAHGYLHNLYRWMEDYNSVVNSLDQIAQYVGATNQQMNTMEDDVDQLTSGDFTGTQADTVFHTLWESGH